MQTGIHIADFRNTVTKLRYTISKNIYLRPWDDLEYLGTLWNTL